MTSLWSIGETEAGVKAIPSAFATFCLESSRDSYALEWARTRDGQNSGKQGRRWDGISGGGLAQYSHYIERKGKLSHRGHSLGSEIRGLKSRGKDQSSGLLESQKDLKGPFRRKAVTLGFELSVPGLGIRNLIRVNFTLCPAMF